MPLNMKCEICDKKINENFLGKIIGTYIKDKSGKLRPICFECQKKFNSKPDMLEKL